jgi:hypothetical protein
LYTRMTTSTQSRARRRTPGTTGDVRLLLAATLTLLALAVPASAANGARTIAWARTEANTHVVADLHDYYGLTLRFVAAKRDSTCTGVGPPVAAAGAREWLRFRCTAWLRADEGTKFPGAVRAIFTLHAPSGMVTNVKVTRCTGFACPVHERSA